ncbi:hypothetical protein [Frigoribacterium sp. NPDC087798]|uniref:hypothetical protein n=1 Tax=Frigoribacterium sp. NPDC087798 TaxID=3363993 RepID=UPI0038275A75
MTSPIFDTLAAEREATPVFRSLASRPDAPQRPFDATRRSPAPHATATATATAKTSTTSAGANATAIRDAVSAVATWPLRAVPC